MLFKYIYVRSVVVFTGKDLLKLLDTAMYHTCQSEKDKDKLVHNNFVYRKAGKNAWACIDRKCGARAIVNPNQPEITTNGGEF